MRYITYFFLIVFVFTTNAQVVCGIIEYGKKTIDYSMSEDYKRMEKENPEKLKKFQRMDKLISDSEKLLSFELKFDNKKALFSINKFLESDNKKMTSHFIGPYDSAKYYYDEKNVIMQLNSFGEIFLVSKPKLNWRITQEEKMIGKYRCKKAETDVVVNSKGRKWKVYGWFAPSIPVSLGPLGYSGLPGIIVELDINRKKYYIKKMSFNLKQEIPIKKPTKGIKVTEKEYHVIINKTSGKYRNYRRN